MADGFTTTPLTGLFKTREAESVFFAAGRDLTTAIRGLSSRQLRGVFRELHESNLWAIARGMRRQGHEPKWIIALRKEMKRRKINPS